MQLQIERFAHLLRSTTLLSGAHSLPLSLCASWHCLRRPISRDDHKLGVVEQILLNVSHSLLVPRDVFPYKDRACMEWCACNFVSIC